jgi:hypothetical protein
MSVSSRARYVEFPDATLFWFLVSTPPYHPGPAKGKSELDKTARVKGKGDFVPSDPTSQNAPAGLNSIELFMRKVML